MVSGVTARVAKRGSGSDIGRDGRRRLDNTGHITCASGALYCVMETAVKVPTGDESSCITEVTDRAAFRAGVSLSSVWREAPLCNQPSQSGDEPDPAPESRLRLAAHRASAQARLVKYNRSIINDPRSEA